MVEDLKLIAIALVLIKHAISCAPELRRLFKGIISCGGGWREYLRRLPFAAVSASEVVHYTAELGEGLTAA